MAFKAASVLRCCVTPGLLLALSETLSLTLRQAQHSARYPVQRAEGLRRMLPSICASVSSSNEIMQTQGQQDCRRSLLGSLHGCSVPTTSLVPLTWRRGDRSPCRVWDWSHILCGAVTVGHQVPGRAEARQRPEETAQGLYGGGQREWTLGSPSLGPWWGPSLFSYLAFGFGGTPGPIS